MLLPLQALILLLSRLYLTPAGPLSPLPTASKESVTHTKLVGFRELIGLGSLGRG